MTTIKFRGFRTDGRGWVEGDLLHGQGSKKGKMYILLQQRIIPKDADPIDGYPIHPSSLGMFTGQTDKNGKEIFGAIGEKGGDVVKHGSEVGYILYLQQSCGFVIVYPNRDTQLGDRYTKGVWTEIIGNQFEQDNGK